MKFDIKNIISTRIVHLDYDLMTEADLRCLTQFIAE